jgi:hypothetical protein
LIQPIAVRGEARPETATLGAFPAHHTERYCSENTPLRDRGQDVEGGADGLAPHHWAELQASAIAPDVAALNVATFGPGSPRHWEDERAEATRFARWRFESGEGLDRAKLPKTWHGRRPSRRSMSGELWHLDRRYRHLQAGGWRSLSAELPGLPRFDQWKPDQARERYDKRGRSIKYEAPPSFPDGGGMLLPQVPERCWRLICQRQELPFPDAATVAAGFWPWAIATPGLQLLICEGWKKALAALSAGWAAVALPGVQMGRRVDADGRERLIEALQLLATGRRRWLIAFDAERKPSTARKVGAAAGALARALRSAGGRVEIARLPLLPGTEKTGLDDLLAVAGPEALAQALAKTGALPVLPRLRRPDVVAPAGQWLAEACPIPSPERAPLVALAAPMGSGKTQAIAAAVAPHLATGTPVVLLTHRRSLGHALAERLGLPWGDDAAPGSDLRLQGVALCVDSLRPDSAVHFDPADWAGAVVVIDEVAQVLNHALFTTGTTIAKHRPEVLENLVILLADSAQVIAADAQLSDDHLQALEAATGHRACLIASEHKPAAGRQLIDHPSRDSWRPELVAQLQAHNRQWIATTAQQAGSKNSAQVLERLALQHWPTAKVLRVDSETIADPDHDASRLAADPNGIAAAYDVVICTPAVAAGLSVDELPGHFAAVFVIAGGTTDPEAVAQAAARVRDDCPRHLYAPERSPGNARRQGCGSFEAAELQRHQSRHGAAILAQLAGSVDVEAGTAGPWLPLWLKLAAISNRQAAAYGATVRGLLEREGYQLVEAGALTPEATADAKEIAEQLQQISDNAQNAEDQAVITAPLLTDEEGHKLSNERRRLEPAERAQLTRWQIGKAWGLGDAAPTPELLEADRDKLNERRRFGWTLGSLDARHLQARADHSAASRLRAHGGAWAPDLCRELVGPKITAADALGLPAWLSRGDWFTAKDPRLLELQANATAAAGDLRQVLDVSPGKTGTATLRRLLRLAGHRLEAKRSREEGDRSWRYRVVAEALPAGVMVERLQEVWSDQLGEEGCRVSQKIPYVYGEE